MPCQAVNRGATLLFMGAASLTNGGSGSSIPEVLNNLWPNAFGLCGLRVRHSCVVLCQHIIVNNIHHDNKRNSTQEV